MGQNVFLFIERESKKFIGSEERRATYFTTSTLRVLQYLGMFTCYLC